MAFRFGLIAGVNSKKRFALNKDLSGGLGTADDYPGNRLSASLARYVKRKTVYLPVLSFAYLQAILRSHSHFVKYFEGSFPDIKKDFLDVILLHGTIVDYRYECSIAEKMKKLYPKAKIGFFGNFPTVMPELFSNFDFIIQGEVESFFLSYFTSPADLSGIIKVKALTDLNELPTPNLDGFPLDRYRYSLFPSRRRFMTLLSSRGCPYSCRYYCPYGLLQGPLIRQRAAPKVIADFKIYKEKYGIGMVQFRDPIFGLTEGFIEGFCEGLIREKIDIQWGVETHLEILNKNKLRLMYRAGLRHINIGIETAQKIIAGKNRRQFTAHDRQAEVISFCRAIGIWVAAFYIFGLEEESREDMAATLRYAKKLNTPVARFSVFTPYPGTDFFDYLKEKKRILTEDFEKYTQFNLVFKHPAITHSGMAVLLRKAYRRYYLRLAYLIGMIRLFLRARVEINQKLSNGFI